MTMKKLLAASIVAACATTANAADLGRYPGSVKDGVYQPEVSWAGFSASVAGGASFYTGDVDALGYDFSLTGFTGLGRLQYDWQAGRLVVGPYADISFTTSSDADVDTRLGFGAGVRAGIAEGNALVYGKLGYHRSHIGSDYLDVSKDLNAVRVGGGLEFRMSQKLTAFAEANIDLYDDVSVVGYKLESTETSVLGGVRYRFGN